MALNQSHPHVVEFWVKWLGFDTSENTYQSLDSLRHLDILKKYVKKYLPKRKRPKTKANTNLSNTQNNGNKRNRQDFDTPKPKKRRLSSLFY